MRKLLGLILLVVSFVACWSANGADQHAATKSSTAKELTSRLIDQKSENEIALLKEQNKLIREYQGSLLDTVYWALGGVFATAALLAGFGWWSNFKLYEADKQRLQQELTTKINELEAKLALRLETNRTELERAVDVKGETHLSRLLTELTDVRANISTLTDESRQRSDEIKAVREALITEIQNTNISVLNTSADLRFVEEFVWDMRGVPENILYTQCQGVEAALLAENTERVNRILSRMKEALQKHFVDKSKALDKITREKIRNTLSSLSVGSSMPAGEVLELLNKIPVEPAK